MANESSVSRTGRLNFQLFSGVSPKSIGLFRIAFGCVMMFEVYRYFDHGWIDRYWSIPAYNFGYWPFDFMKPLLQPGMDILFVCLGILALLIALGLYYRVAISLFFLGFSYVFLLEQTRYLNHFYLISILSFIMIFIDAHAWASLDNYRKKRKASQVPQWQLWLLRFMIGVPYFFGGVAKINSDWLAGEPLGEWLENDTDVPLIGPYFTEEWMILLMSYSGLLLDLLLVPALLWRKTRLAALFVGASFHILNSQIFTIGIFPWFMLLATVIYFDPDLGWLPKTWRGSSLDIKPNFFPPSKKVKWALGAWVFLMCFLPMRHHLFPGNVSWTEEGHRYAWHMKLRTKKARGAFIVLDVNTGESFVVDPNEILEPWQAERMLGKPYLIWQFVQLLGKQYQAAGREVRIYAKIDARLNNREYQPFVDTSVDLLTVPRPLFSHSYWIVPLREPLKNRWEEK